MNHSSTGTGHCLPIPGIKASARRRNRKKKSKRRNRQNADTLQQHATLASRKHAVPLNTEAQVNVLNGYLRQQDAPFHIKDSTVNEEKTIRNKGRDIIIGSKGKARTKEKAKPRRKQKRKQVQALRGVGERKAAAEKSTFNTSLASNTTTSKSCKMSASGQGSHLAEGTTSRKRRKAVKIGTKRATKSNTTPTQLRTRRDAPSPSTVTTFPEPSSTTGLPTSLSAWLLNPKCHPNASNAILRVFEPSRELVIIEDFLPQAVAESALKVFARSQTTASWQLAQARTDRGSRAEGAGTTEHRYHVGDGSGDRDSERVFLGLEKVMKGLIPSQNSAFQAGRYTRGCFIEPHDDVAYRSFPDMASGRECKHVRDVAVILYLTKDWKRGYGGLFSDLRTGLRHVPKFNSLVAFRVPRMHEVTVMKTDRQRFTVFGWFYRRAPGRRMSASRKKAKRNRRKRKKNGS